MKLKYDQIIPNIDTSFFISLTVKYEKFCIVNVCRLQSLAPSLTTMWEPLGSIQALPEKINPLS